MSVTVAMPQLGETVTEGTILTWIKQIGEYVDEDDILVEISTDKVDTEIPSPASGILSEILVAAGTTVDVGTDICVLTQDDSGDAVAADESESGPIDSEDTAAADASATSSSEPTGAADNVRRGVLSPVVRKLAREHGIDVAMVPGTGGGGRITRSDVEKFVADRGSVPQETPAQAPAPAVSAPAAAAAAPAPSSSPAVGVAGGDVREIPRLRSLIAENMSNARRVAAHVWTSVEVDYERVESVRTAHKVAFKESEGFSLTYLPFIARATIEALATYPVVNSRFDLEAGTHTFNKHVNLGLAIDLNQGGLIVANIAGADSMTMKAIARSISSTAAAARSNELVPDDLAGYTFSITNPGPFGSYMSAPIIPPPNAAILSTDTIKKRPVAIEMPDGSDGIVIHHIGYLGLSWDHRVFDGSTAVLFLNRIRHNLETWDWEQELR